MSTGYIDSREHKKTPPHLNHSSKHSIGFQGVTSSEEGEPIVLDPDPAKYWHDICTVPLGPYSRVYTPLSIIKLNLAETQIFCICMSTYCRKAFYLMYRSLCTS